MRYQRPALAPGSYIYDGALGSLGSLLRLIHSGQAATRSDLVSITGLARSTVAARVETLLESGYVYESGARQSTGGRPSVLLAFNHPAGVALAADLGATHCRLEVTDLAGHPLAIHESTIDIADGATKILRYMHDRFDGLLAEAGRAAPDVRAVGIGVPGPVEFATGTPVSPPIMPGWDGVSISERFGAIYDAPVLVDNDVNIMALGEQRTEWPDCQAMLFVKAGTGIGCGLVMAGKIYRGAQGAAGDIGHIRLSEHDDIICACGNLACVEAVAGGAAVARQLRDLGHEAHTASDVVRLVRAGNVDAVRAVRRAGRHIGEVLASLVNFFNPAVIVVGGAMAMAHEQLLAGMRESVYQRSLPLATRHLLIVETARGREAGVTGAALMALEQILSDDVIGSQIKASAAPASGL